MSLEVAASDVLQLILQFLHEHQLYSTVRALQDEAQVGLASVVDVRKLTHCVLQGQWDAVLSSTQPMRLPTPLLFDLHEHIVLELTEMREADTARALLRSSAPLLAMKKEAPERYLRLEHAVSRAAVEPHVAYPGGQTKDGRRQRIAEALSSEVREVPPSRLLTLLTQAVKWQQLQGALPASAGLDLFTGQPTASALAAASPTSVPAQQSRVIHFAPGSQALALSFSPDGRMLASGSSDGWLEVWDADTGKLNPALAYQGRDELMGHDGDGIMAVGWGMDGELLGSGGRSGELRVWRVQSGVCLRKWPRAHSTGVTSVAFVRDGSQILSSSHDGTIRYAPSSRAPAHRRAPTQSAHPVCLC